MTMPRYAQDAIMNQGQEGMFGSFNPMDLAGGLSSIFGGLFGNSGRPYQDYQKALAPWYNEAMNKQQPYYQAGVNAIPLYQQWLQGMQNPSGFINNLMGQYQESPWAKYQQDQAMRAAENAASTGESRIGGLGSTPYGQFLQQNARDISSQDMQNWLGRVLGINTQYGAGQQNLMAGGQNAANSLSQLNADVGQRLAEAEMGRSAREQQDTSNFWGGLFKTGASLLPLFL